MSNKMKIATQLWVLLKNSVKYNGKIWYTLFYSFLRSDSIDFFYKKRMLYIGNCWKWTKNTNRNLVGAAGKFDHTKFLVYYVLNVSVVWIQRIHVPKGCGSRGFQRGIGSPGHGFRQIPSVHSRHRKQISVHSAAMRLIHSPKIREEVTETSSGTLFGQHGTDVKMETLISWTFPLWFCWLCANSGKREMSPFPAPAISGESAAFIVDAFYDGGEERGIATPTQPKIWDKGEKTLCKFFRLSW